MNEEFSPSLDAQLHGAAGDLAYHLPDVPPGEFKPSRRRSVTVAGFVAAVMVGSAAWGLSRQVQPQPVEVATVDESVVEERAGQPEEANARPAPQVLSNVNLGAEPVRRNEMDNPDVGRFVIDPAFGSTLVRLTDVGANEALVPVATTPSAWNVDETYLLLYRTGGDDIGHELYRFDPSGAVELESKLDLNAADIEQVYWSRVDPDVLYYVDGVALVSYDVVSGESSTLMSFEGCEQVDSGVAPVPQSADDNRWGLRCLNGDATELMAYNRQTGTVQRQTVDGASQGPYPIETDDGYLIERVDRVDLVDAELNLVRTVPNLEPENVAAVVRVGEAELAVGPVYDSEVVGNAVAVSLTEPEVEAVAVVGPDAGYPYPPAGTHRGETGQVSQPSLALAIAGGTAEGVETLLDGEVVAVDMATSTAVRLAHHRSSSSSAFSNPTISMSPSGRFIVFASDWGGGATNVYLLYRP